VRLAIYTTAPTAHVVCDASSTGAEYINRVLRTVHNGNKTNTRTQASPCRYDFNALYRRCIVCISLLYCRRHKRKPPRATVSHYCIEGDTNASSPVSHLYLIIVLQETHKHKPSLATSVSHYCTAGDTNTSPPVPQSVSHYCTAGDTNTSPPVPQSVSHYCTAGDTNTSPPVPVCVSLLYCRRHKHKPSRATVCVSLLYCNRHPCFGGTSCLLFQGQKIVSGGVRLKFVTLQTCL
jgi:hypothetical protein